MFLNQPIICYLQNLYFPLFSSEAATLRFCAKVSTEAALSAPGNIIKISATRNLQLFISGPRTGAAAVAAAAAAAAAAEETWMVKVIDSP